MFVSWVSGKQLLEQHWSELEQGQYRVAIFFLIPEYNASALADVVRLAAELDRVTGASCLAIAFMPPPEDQQAVLRRYRAGMLPESGAPGSKQFAEAMTRATYDIADYFNVPYAALPCLLFFSLESGNELAIVRLREHNISDIFQKLRALFFDWANENKDLVAIQRARIALNHPPSRINASSSGSTKSAVREVNEKFVLPVVSDALFKAFDASGSRKRIGGVINDIRANPFMLKSLQALLAKSGVALVVNGINLSATDTAQSYDLIYEAIARDALGPLLNSAMTPSVPFPFSRIRDMDRDIALRTLASNAANVGAKAGNVLKWLSDVRKLAG